MKGFKVRIGDGSEIGPMDVDALRTWIAQGLVDEESPVMRPGSRTWVPLGSVPELKGATAPSRRSGAAGRNAARTRGSHAEPPDAGRLDRWRSAGVGVLLLGLAGLLAVPVFRPDVVLPALDGAPWLEVSLASLAFGLALLPGWSFARKLVRGLLFLAAFAVFPIAGILIAQGERGAVLLALGSAWLLVSGLMALLAPSLGWGRLLLALVPVLAGAAGVIRFGRAPEMEDASRVREWSAPERRFSDETLGLTLTLPPGWVTLRPGNPLVQAPADARATFAHPRRGGFAFLISGPAPHGVANAEQYLDQVITRRRGERPGYEVGSHANAVVGSLAGRRATAAWSDAAVRHNEVIVAGVDGWMGFALVGWMPEAGASRPSDGLDPLAGALAARGLLVGRLREAVEAAAAAVPHLTPATAEQLMSKSEARVLDPEQAFRRSVTALARQLPTLSKAESRELGGLTAAAYQALSWADRSRLSSYIERLQRGDATSASEDREMAGLMKTAEERLSPARLGRLRAYYDKAVQLQD